jgi:hypothetical protein
MIDWEFVSKVFLISVLGTFYSMGILTLVISILGVLVNYFEHRKKSRKN